MLPSAPQIIGKKGNVSIAGLAWETEQVYLQVNNAVSGGTQLLPAPELYKRRNCITSFIISTDHNNGSVIYFSGVNDGIGAALLMNKNTPVVAQLLDPIIFATGCAVNVVSSDVANIYVTAKYFVE